MKVITLANLKGGSGKTTLAAHLATEATKSGAVVMADLDPQASTAHWRAMRSVTAPVLAEISVYQLAGKLPRMANAGCDYTILDTPASLLDTVRTAMSCSDLVVVPVKPTPVDIRALDRTIDMAKQLRKPFRLVVTQAQPGTKLAHRMADELSKVWPVAPVIIHQRTLYAMAMESGRCASEVDRTSMAASEISQLWRWLSEEMEELEPAPPAAFAAYRR